jgi:hypothetical protein
MVERRAMRTSRRIDGQVMKSIDEDKESEERYG